MIVIIMGVCGSGKTTIGEALAKKLSCSFADADDFHSPENKKKMANGTPLTDKDRIPWLLAIHEYMKQLTSESRSGVLTCSALKLYYRNILRCGSREAVQISPENTTKLTKNTPDDSKDKNIAESIEGVSVGANDDKNVMKHSSDSNIHDQVVDVAFVHLNGRKEVIQERLKTRKGHFMPPELLTSQLATLEPLNKDEKGLTVDIEMTPQNIVAEVLEKLDLN